MAEVLGAVTGAIGACDVIARATLKSLEYISEVKAAPKHIERLKNELETLEAVISALQGFLKSARVARNGFTESCPIFIFVDKCKDYVVELEQYFAEKRTQSRLLWPLDAKPGIEKRLEGIHKFVNLFHLSLSANGWSYFCKEAEEASKMLRQELEEWREVRRALQPINSMSKDLEHIRNHCSVIETGLTLLEESMSVQLADITVQLQAKIDKDSAAELKRSHDELLNWLSRNDLLVKHRQTLGTRREGTGKWVEQMLQETEWLSKESPGTLWCHGIPGCGKTVIFSTLLEHIKAQADANCTLIAAIYFDYKDKTLHNLRSTLAALIRQMIESSPDSERLVELVRFTKDTCAVRGQSAPNVSDLDGLLHRIEDLGYSFILCFDALDEVSESVQFELLSWLSRTSTLRSLKTLLTSRSNIKIRPWGEIFLERRLIATVEDLRIFLKANITDTQSEDLRNILTRCPSLEDEIVSMIVSRSDGMFLLACLQFNQIEEALSEREIRDLLHGTSDKVIELYEIYLTRIRSHRHSSLAMRAISWVHLARGPLTASELLEALAIRAEDTALNRTGMIAIERVLSMTGGLLVYEPESHHVRLVHETLEAYLRGPKGKALLDTHLSVAEILKAYICFDVFRSQLPLSTTSRWVDISSICRTHKLVDYAMRNWGYHVCEAGSSATSVGLRIAERIAESPMLVALIKFLGLLPHPLIDGEGFSTVHVAALLQCPLVVVHSVHKHVAEVDHSHSTLDNASQMGLTPLHLASMVNNLKAVQVLVKNGASIAAKDRNGRTAVYWAAYCASADALQYLLADRDAIQMGLVNVGDVDRVTPLHISIRRGHAHVAEALVDNGAIQDALTSAEQTPLHYAVQYLPQVTALLLKGGPDLEQISNNGRTCLAWACVLGDEECLQSLLRSGATINVKDRDGATPLHILMESKTQPLQATKLLVNQGANPHARDHAGLTPILLALYQRHFLAAECLLSQQVVSNQDRDAQILLLRAASDHSDCPEFIWDKLGDVNIQNNRGESAVHLAATDQRVTQVRNLHEHGADLELRDIAGDHPLHLAVRHFVKSRHISHLKDSGADVVSTLLARGASVVSRAQSGRTPICEALEKSSVPLLQILFRYFNTEDHKPDLDRRWLTTCIEGQSSESLEMLAVLLQQDVKITSKEDMPKISLLSMAVRDLLSLLSQEKQVFIQQKVRKHRARRNSMELLTKSSSHVACEHSGRCSSLQLVCKKIYLLLSWGASPNLVADEGQLNGLSPRDALLTHQPAFVCVSSAKSSPCDAMVTMLITRDILAPEPLIRERKIQDHNMNFEWNDRISLLLDTSRPSRQSSRLLQVPGQGRRVQRASDGSIDSPRSPLSFRRPTTDGMHGEADIKAYNASRTSLWHIEEDFFS